MNLTLHNKMTGRIFFERYPSLLPFMLKELRTFVDSSDTLIKPSVQSILLLLSRLYPSFNLDEADTKWKVSYFPLIYFPNCRIETKNFPSFIFSSNILDQWIHRIGVSLCEEQGVQDPWACSSRIGAIVDKENSPEFDRRAFREDNSWGNVVERAARLHASDSRDNEKPSIRDRGFDEISGVALYERHSMDHWESPEQQWQMRVFSSSERLPGGSDEARQIVGHWARGPGVSSTAASSRDFWQLERTTRSWDFRTGPCQILYQRDGKQNLRRSQRKFLQSKVNLDQATSTQQRASSNRCMERTSKPHCNGQRPAITYRHQSHGKKKFQAKNRSRFPKCHLRLFLRNSNQTGNFGQANFSRSESLIRHHHHATATSSLSSGRKLSSRKPEFPETTRRSLWQNVTRNKGFYNVFFFFSTTICLFFRLWRVNQRDNHNLRCQIATLPKNEKQFRKFSFHFCQRRKIKNWLFENFSRSSEKFDWKIQNDWCFSTVNR